MSYLNVIAVLELILLFSHFSSPVRPVLINGRKQLGGGGNRDEPE